MGQEFDPDFLRKIGVKIGHYTDNHSLRGVTTFLAEEGATIGFDIRGAGSGTFNTPLYDVDGIADTVNAVVFTGGSLFGLESIFGVMDFLEKRSAGFKIGATVLPNVIGACIYDLHVGNKDERPGKQEGILSAQNASYENLEQGNIGVGVGATTGKCENGIPLKGGFGMAYSSIGDDSYVAAFVVTNAMGNVLGTKNQFNKKPSHSVLDLHNPPFRLTQNRKEKGSSNTTLVLIASNLRLGKLALRKVAQMTHDGIARAIFPVHTMNDGDVVFAISSLSGIPKEFPSIKESELIDIVGIVAQDLVVKAIEGSLLHARGIPGFPSISSE